MSAARIPQICRSRSSSSRLYLLNRVVSRCIDVCVLCSVQFALITARLVPLPYSSHRSTSNHTRTSPYELVPHTYIRHRDNAHLLTSIQIHFQPLTYSLNATLVDALSRQRLT
jgi:hypothetical protein